MRDVKKFEEKKVVGGATGEGKEDDEYWIRKWPKKPSPIDSVD